MSHGIWQKKAYYNQHALVKKQLKSEGDSAMFDNKAHPKGHTDRGNEPVTDRKTPHNFTWRWTLKLLNT